MDHIDIAQARQQQANDDAVQAATSRTTAGSPACVECGEPITPLRQSLGALRCVYHQELIEKGRRP